MKLSLRPRSGPLPRANPAVTFPIQGDGFILREFEPSDANALVEIEFDAEVKQFLGLPKKSKAEFVRGVQRFGIEGWIIQAFEGQVAGNGALTRAKRKGDAELRVVIGKPFWGNALGKKVATLLVQIAFQYLNAKAVVAVVHPENKASLSIVRALSFRRRGVIAAAVNSWQAGHYVYRMPRNVYKNKFKLTVKSSGL